MVLGCLGWRLREQARSHLVSGWIQDVCLPPIHCGSGLARESGVSACKDVERKVAIANPFAMRS
jgi:hypothetical protein